MSANDQKRGYARQTVGNHKGGKAAMKRLRLVVLLALVALCASAEIQAVEPPPTKTLAERVDLATHIFLGTAKIARVVKIEDGKVQEIKPEPKTLSVDQFVELEIVVGEVLFPADYKPKGKIKYLFGGGLFSVGDIRKDTLDNRLIYVARVSDKVKEPCFHQSYGWQLCDSLDDRKEIEDVLKKRAKK
jgi:hypothetical protein